MRSAFERGVNFYTMRVFKFLVLSNTSDNPMQDSLAFDQYSRIKDKNCDHEPELSSSRTLHQHVIQRLGRVRVYSNFSL